MRRVPASDASRSVRLRIGVARPMRGRPACGRGCDALRWRPGPGAERPGGDGPALPGPPLWTYTTYCINSRRRSPPRTAPPKQRMPEQFICLLKTYAMKDIRTASGRTSVLNLWRRVFPPINLSSRHQRCAGDPVVSIALLQSPLSLGHYPRCR